MLELRTVRWLRGGAVMRKEFVITPARQAVHERFLESGKLHWTRGSLLSMRSQLYRMHESIPELSVEAAEEEIRRLLEMVEQMIDQHKRAMSPSA